MACLAKIKLIFMDLFYYNLIILIKWCKISYKNLGKVLLVLKNQVFSLKFENFDELQLSYSSIFFAETSHTFSTYQYLQKVSGIFFILSQSWVICKNLKRPGFFKKTHSFFCTFINNSRSTQNKKNPAHDFVDITK